MLVEPYICEMTDNSVYIDEITSRYAYLPSYVSELGRSVDSDANLSIARRLFFEAGFVGVWRIMV